MSKKKINEGDINVTIKDQDKTEFVTTRVRLDIRKTLDGNIVVRDHDLFDIMIFPAEGRIETYPKDNSDPLSFRSQRTFFMFLVDKGVVNRKSIDGGEIYGSLEGEFLESEMEEQSSLQALIYVIYKYMEKEKPKLKFTSDIIKKRMKDLVDPDIEVDPYKIKKKQDQYMSHRQIDKYGGAHAFNHPYYGLYFLQEGKGK